jgi:hypothetical protein
VLIRVMSVLRIVLIARGRLRQRGEAGFRGRVVALIHVAKEPPIRRRLLMMRRWNVVIRIRAPAPCGRPSPAETGREMALLRDREVVE